MNWKYRGPKKCPQHPDGYHGAWLNMNSDKAKDLRQRCQRCNTVRTFKSPTTVKAREEFL